MLKAYKYRIYPNREQEQLIAKTFGCCRFVFNRMLDIKKEKYEQESISLSRIDCNNICNRELKAEHEWLREVDKFALTNAIYSMDAAYQNFFRSGAGFPRFRSRRDGHKSYTTNFTNGNISVDFDAGRIKLPKLKQVRARLHREFTGRIKSATVSQTPSGKYFVSILVETEHEPLPKADGKVGLDLGIKDLCITSDGHKYANPKALAKEEMRLAHLQRQLAHKRKGSRNYRKQKRKVARCHEKIANMRRDHLHKLSHGIVSENQVIASESLQVGNMVRNHHLAKSISDASWGELTRQLAYKAEWNGRSYVKVGMFFPSSQLCSACGYKYAGTKDLSVRGWECPRCGAHHDRDVNAAKNILAEGMRLMTSA